MNEREEARQFEAEREEKLGAVKGEMNRFVGVCKSAYLVGVTPKGEMVNICFFDGYADIRAMQIESEDRLQTIAETYSSQLPTQII